MPRIVRPSPPEHLVIVDTNILWTDDKGVVVHPDFDVFWEKYSGIFPMKLIIPYVVRGELLFQQVTSASKLLDKANQHIHEVSRVTGKAYSHRVTCERIKKEIEQRFDAWLQSKQGELKAVPLDDIAWEKVIEDSIWRNSPFTADPKNPKNEKGFRDYMILETVCAVCRFYSAEVNIAFICGDYPLREAADSRLGSIESFTTYESISDFSSFIELTRKNLTERFVKSILARARTKFHSEEDECLLFKDGLINRIRETFKSKIENPVVEGTFGFLDFGKRAWKHIGEETVWVTRPQFLSLEGDDVYHWNSVVTFYRLYEREQSEQLGIFSSGERRLVVLSVDVHWKATVRSDGRFFDTEVVDYKESKYSFEQPKEEYLADKGIFKPAAQPSPAKTEKGKVDSALPTPSAE